MYKSQPELSNSYGYILTQIHSECNSYLKNPLFLKLLILVYLRLILGRFFIKHAVNTSLYARKQHPCCLRFDKTLPKKAAKLKIFYTFKNEGISEASPGFIKNLNRSKSVVSILNEIKDH